MLKICNWVGNIYLADYITKCFCKISMQIDKLKKGFLIFLRNSAIRKCGFAGFV